MKFGCIVIQMVNMFDIVVDYMRDDFNSLSRWYHSLIWLIVTLIMILAQVKKIGLLLRISVNILIVRNIFTLYEWEDIPLKYDDQAWLFAFFHVHKMVLLVFAIVPMCVRERAYFHIPISVMYHLALAYGQTAHLQRKMSERQQDDADDDIFETSLEES